MELRRMGVRKPSLLKSYLRDFEKYIGNHYSFEILKTKKEARSPSQPGLRIPPEQTTLFLIFTRQDGNHVFEV